VQPPSARPGLADMSPTERAEVDALAADLPCVDVGVAVGVLDGDSDDPKADGLDFVAVGDIVTVLVTLSYANVLSRPGCGPATPVPPVFAPHSPVPKAEEWHLFLTDGNDGAKLRLVQYKTLVSTPDKPFTAVTTEKLQFMAPDRAGRVTYRLHVRSACYAGLDQVLDVPFEVKPKSEVPTWVEHAEDRELDEGKDQALESMMGGGGVDDDSDEEADGDAGGGGADGSGSGSGSGARAGGGNPLIKRAAGVAAGGGVAGAAAGGGDDDASRGKGGGGGGAGDDDELPSLLRGANNRAKAGGGKKAAGGAAGLLAKAKVAAAAAGGDSDDD
jgi:hypothetical protein